MSIALEKQNRIGPLSFAAGIVFFALMAMGLTAVLPLGVSVAIVFLFAGPHNYVEARYFLTRLPARMGRLRGFFLFSAAGIISLTIVFPLLTRIPGWFGWPRNSLVWLVGGWNTALILWATHLISLRAAQPPRRRWDYAWPAGLALTGLSWLQPMFLPLIMVYLHPLAGLWVLDREICRRRPDWQRSFRLTILLIPALLAILWYSVAPITAGGVLITEDMRQQIVSHSGAGWFSESVGRRLIATHAFLELLHYGVWIIAIPLASGRVFAQPFENIPLMKRSTSVRRMIRYGLLGSAFVVLLLWLCFATNYTTTRDVYFTIAMLHVLAEIPFLLRLL